MLQTCRIRALATVTAGLVPCKLGGRGAWSGAGMAMGRFGLFACVVLAVGCQKGGEACTKARLDAANAWKTVESQAGNAKVNGWPGFEELSEAQKAESVKTWAAIETQADMVFNSFAYERITWKTADPAREETHQKFQGFFAKDNFTLFTAALKTADQKYDTASKLCRE